MTAERPFPQTIEVRPARRADLPGLEHVARETWHATYRGHLPDEAIEQFVRDHYNQAVLERMHDSPRVTALVAVVGDDVVGYAMVDNDEGELLAIYVLPDWQGRGVGAQLWDATMRELRVRGHARVFLWVLDENESARGFYERQGGRATERRSFQVSGVPIQEIRYELVLDA